MITDWLKKHSSPKARAMTAEAGAAHGGGGVWDDATGAVLRAFWMEINKSDVFRIDMVWSLISRHAFRVKKEYKPKK